MSRLLAPPFLAQTSAADRCNRNLPLLVDAANLSGADLRGLDLRGLDLRDANLNDVDLRGADLRGISGVTEQEVRAVAKVDQDTKFR
ncbi:Pentapeptide repeat-containing protein [Sinosporangium album]|uniref:Pentapeptide repeat-containing protein n=1 Tax=Sinosporangium album TaxID=504805 RepID=A0A1G8EE26_9ACTN|nr:pentapeptide repeat-containing protein [Sinosporangium album]SDH68162.1 Pentapeptide repeat-containing protein [Sinosporangium album]